MQARSNLRARGFSIVEVLVALVVLATGMLGIASLYVTTLRASGSAISRMQAVNLASDLGDRIRANRTAGEAYEGAAADPADAGACLGTTANCTPEEVAAQDLLLWNAQIADTLPTGATGTVTVTPEAGGIATYEILLTWTEPGEGNLTYRMRFQR
jgi:type IV pilus assembly protein PilV